MNGMEQAARSLKRACGLTSGSPVVRFVRPAYDWWLKAACSDRIERVLTDEPPLWVRPAHRYVDERYEHEVRRRLKTLVRPGDTVLDIGAHIGLFSVVAARWVGPGGRVVAFEPSPETRAALVDHLELNRVRDRVDVRGEAIAAVSGAADFFSVAFSPESTLNPVHSRLGEASSLRVPVTTIDTFCEANLIGPRVIKIDVEGLELQALRGAARTIGRARPAVLVEMHPMNWHEVGESVSSADCLLRSLGCRIEAIGGQDPLRDLGHLLLTWT